MALKLPLVAIETEAVAKVSRSQIRITHHSGPALAELGLVKLGADVVMVEQIAHPGQPVAPGQEEDQVGRVAAVDHVEAGAAADGAGEAEPGAERGAVFARIGERAGMRLGRHRMAPDADPLDLLIRACPSRGPSGRSPRPDSPPRCSAVASSQTRRSSGTGRFSTTISTRRGGSKGIGRPRLPAAARAGPGQGLPVPYSRCKSATAYSSVSPRPQPMASARAQ